MYCENPIQLRKLRSFKHSVRLAGYECIIFFAYYTFIEYHPNLRRTFIKESTEIRNKNWQLWINVADIRLSFVRLRVLRIS